MIKTTDLFPDVQITSKSTDREIKQIMIYNDYYYDEPEIVFLNLNYTGNQALSIKKALNKHIIVNKLIQK